MTVSFYRDKGHTLFIKISAHAHNCFTSHETLIEFSVEKESVLHF